MSLSMHNPFVCPIGDKCMRDNIAHNNLLSCDNASCFEFTEKEWQPFSFFFCSSCMNFRDDCYPNVSVRVVLENYCDAVKEPRAFCISVCLSTSLQKNTKDMLEAPCWSIPGKNLNYQGYVLMYVVLTLKKIYI